MMPRTAVIIKEASQQYEGVRTSLGLLLHGGQVQLFILDHEIEVVDDAFRDNVAFIDEMKGERFSNNSVNVEHHGFKHLTLTEMAEKLDRADIVIPF